MLTFAEGSIEQHDKSTIIEIELGRSVLADALAQLSCLRFEVSERLHVNLGGGQALRLRTDEAIASQDRAKIDVRDTGYVLTLSSVELEAWLAFLASCYWHHNAPVDHVDLFVFDDEGREYDVVLRVCWQN